MVSLGIYVTAQNWDPKNGKVINQPNRHSINALIKQKMNEFERAMLSLFVPETKATAKFIKHRILEHISKVNVNDNSFVSRFSTFAETRNRSRTREIYRNTLKRIQRFDQNAEDLSFEDIDEQWLQSFDAYMDKNGISQNTKAIEFRNIRAVVNQALCDNIIQFSPFRRFKIRHEQTTKRSLSREEICGIFNYRCKPSGHTRYYDEYICVLKLILFLRGINIIDLLALKKSNYVNGYIHYQRSKTMKFYDVKVEPEAAQIIEHLKGKKEYLLCCMDRYDNYKNYARHLNDAMKIFGKNGSLTTYYLRHSWATICINKLHIPIEIVSAGLGHDFGNKTTAVYVNFDQDEVDKANRRLIDYILYDKL